jgi:Rap1a immunity proteins
MPVDFKSLVISSVWRFQEPVSPRPGLAANQIPAAHLTPMPGRVARNLARRSSSGHTTDRKALCLVNMMAVRTALVAAVFLIVLFPRHLAAIESARELVGYCEAAEKGVTGSGHEVEIPATPEALQCWGYMEAFQDLSALVDQSGTRLLGVCPPEQGTLLDLVHSFVAYARTHRADLPDKSAVAVIKALQQAYPCPARGQQRPKR